MKELGEIRKRKRRREIKRGGEYDIEINRGREKLKTGHCKRINDNWHVSNSTN